ncbi:MAG: hypothetical protein ABIX28_21790 [Vicinamibacterales bacterium]
MYRAIVVAALIIPAAACASAQARTPLEPVSLDIPVVPPRLVETVVIDPPPAPPVEEPAQAPVPVPATRTRQPNRDPNRADARPEPKPDPEPEPVTTAPVPPPVPPLRTGTQSASTDEAKRQIMEIVQRARGMLDGINTQGMSDDRLANYESAKDSIIRAEAALKASNLVLARQSADRAENIAKLLISR